VRGRTGRGHAPGTPSHPGLSLIPSLPADNPTRQAAAQAETGFAEGILSPTELLVQAPGVASKQAELSELQRSLAGEPGVAGVLGPADEVIPEMRSGSRPRTERPPGTC
jgi:RND superfamily putative drug exporter